jgi:hypothetical protein
MELIYKAGCVPTSGPLSISIALYLDQCHPADLSAMMDMFPTLPTLEPLEK